MSRSSITIDSSEVMRPLSCGNSQLGQINDRKVPNRPLSKCVGLHQVIQTHARMPLRLTRNLTSTIYGGQHISEL
jgi:hypothetical protein